ncbi:hypothetical protein PBY51_010008 [Eleginops maclovinus]|uniref:Transcobalamin-like C-terminal domain-containing protein n=1 Tax=Eleginops maclovinus TaxID=56733 RepID=A0AAN7XV67_ELEMC|nr:hypothetical protein PBY51_010008 [Eleginops maclovinus]
MMMMMTVVLSAALLLLIPGTLTQSIKLLPIDVVVKTSSNDIDPLTFSTHVADRGILLGALNRLMDTNANFKFTYSDNPNFGPYLESVNGVAGNDTQHTYWKLQVKTADGKVITPDVGIGCYIPKANEQIILTFSKW